MTALRWNPGTAGGQSRHHGCVPALEGDKPAMVPQLTLEPLRRWDPERIGPYSLLGRLGAGAMGQVYLGRSTAGRLVAVKTIKIEFAEEAGFRARFAHEVAAARRVSGVFTAAVVAADPEADMPWLATAYVPAPSLSHLVRSCGPLPVPAVRWLAAGCAEALESIHSAGLVHRDLKPSNVLVSPDGPRVIDFGVARAAERIQLTVTRGAVGTPAYMAPEQARDTRQASLASDVFSLGATLLFAAAGHAPYRGETVMDILVRLATEPPDLTGLPAELTDIVAACLERSPRKRPTSAALLAQLAPYMEGTSGSGPPSLPGPATALIAEYQRHPQPSVTQAADEISDDATFGSHTALPAARRFPARRWPLRRRGNGRGPGRGGGTTAAPRSRAARRRRKALTVAALACAAAALLAGGTVLGVVVKTDSLPPRPGLPGLPGPVATNRSATPELLVNQPYGDGNTVFVLHGSGWKPGQGVAVRLVGHGASPYPPTADATGTFNYAINEAHEFFPGQIPIGHYVVVVSQAGQGTMQVPFQVGGQPPPGGPPPGGALGGGPRPSNPPPGQ
jgi:serine/threonine protein kinase